MFAGRATLRQYESSEADQQQLLANRRPTARSTRGQRIR
jgi:hypothetical protein